MTSARPDVMVIGAGVSGLTTAVRLAEAGIRVRIRAQRRPEESTSAAAGAIWDPLYANHPLVLRWSSTSYEVFCELVAAGRPELRPKGNRAAGGEPRPTARPKQCPIKIAGCAHRASRQQPQRHRGRFSTG